MKKLILTSISILLLLTACTSFSSVMNIDELSEPSWMIRTPERRGMTAFTASASGSNEDQAFNAAANALLDSVSSYLGYDIRSRYYRELTLFSSVSELGLSIANRSYSDGVCYLLAYADSGALEAQRSDEYRAVLEREARISDLIAEAMAYYRENNDVDAINSYLEAISVSASGDIFTPDYKADVLLERALGWLKNIRITVSGVSEDNGTATVRVRRNRGLFSPAVSNAPIEATLPVRRSDGSIVSYTIPMRTGSDGRAYFGDYYPPMANSGRVTFSLDLSEQLSSAAENTPAGFFDEFESVLSGVSASFEYDIRSRKAEEGIVVVFNEFSDRGELYDSSYAEDAFIGFLQDEGIEVVEAEGIYDELSEAVEDIHFRYPDMKYLVWGRAGITGEDITPQGRTVRVSGGYTVLASLSDGAIIAEDSITQSVNWGEGEEEPYLEELFARYGKAVAAFIVQYL